jgi:beta-lactamase superfamily II metal-dependent hydrolase
MDDDEILMDDDAQAGWQPGKFSFFYVNVGQGDCTFIVCPDQQIILVDCGSTAGFDTPGLEDKVVVDTLVDLLETYAKDQKTIDHLILTHPDQDHYNQLGHTFRYKSLGRKVQIPRVYFSCAYDNVNPMARYNVNWVNSFIYFYSGPGLLMEVNINSTTAGENYVRSWDKAELGTDPEVDYLANFSYWVTGDIMDSSWSVEIVAGNVNLKYPMKEKVDSNTASLVVLLKVGAEKILMVGDATDKTMRFVQQTSPDAITDVSLVNVSHHGSDRNCNEFAYVQGLNASAAVVSAGYSQLAYNLPKRNALQRYMANLANKPVIPTHQFDAWYKNTKPAANSIVQGWQANDDEFVIANGLWILLEAPDQGPWMVNKSSGMTYYRIRTTLNLQMTSTAPVDHSSEEFIFFQLG